eukprot:scaffold18385_cov42-Phaeocystis_antarctica.AAC.2
MCVARPKPAFPAFCIWLRHEGCGCALRWAPAATSPSWSRICSVAAQAGRVGHIGRAQPELLRICSVETAVGLVWGWTPLMWAHPLARRKSARPPALTFQVVRKYHRNTHRTRPEPVFATIHEFCTAQAGVNARVCGIPPDQIAIARLLTTQVVNGCNQPKLASCVPAT